MYPVLKAAPLVEPKQL